ncbi:MAG: multidrug transporter [Candidatus Phytoplasma asteris]|uniref:Probable multidrug resistance protein NorM n=2 Tax=16SrI (Aster yellows group) TaxID=3042590 RepID=A6QKR2_ONYPH|nr:MAG: Na+ driven multidrug efflux pump [Periwinkle leaf yellowing phytoplasma]WEX19840.1 MAG: multidrug transporter [Candidatus Phytoplasma asteris]BAF73548.1 Na+-driven multidrug efflux pump [Onion yellows phytoplasma OY-W]
MTKNKVINKKDKISRLVLEGNLLKALWIISLPIIVFNVFKACFGSVDTFFGAGLEGATQSYIQFSKSAQSIVEAVGVCLGITGVSLISREVGKNKNVKSLKARKIASSVFVLLFIVSLVVAFVMIGFSSPICSLFLKEKVINGVPKAITTEEKNLCINAFRLQMLGTILAAINVFFLGIERILGKLKKILVLNCIMMGLKIGLSTLCFGIKVIGLEALCPNVLGLQTASCLAYLFITIVAFFTLLNKKNPLFLSLGDFSFKTCFQDKKLLKTILKLSITLTIGKFIYEGGRMFTLFMVDSTFDKPFLAGTPFEFKGLGGLGAIGVADSIITLFAQISFSLKEGQLMIVAENLGNKNNKRAIKTLMLVSFCCFLVFAVAYLICAPKEYCGLGFGDHLCLFFKNLGKEKKDQMTLDMFHAKNPEFKSFLLGALLTTGLLTTQLEVFSTFLIAAKQPKYDLLLSFGRVFLFRIPALYFFRNVWFGNEEKTSIKINNAYGFANFSANFIMLIFMVFVCVRFVYKLKKEKQPKSFK